MRPASCNWLQCGRLPGVRLPLEGYVKQCVFERNLAAHIFHGPLMTYCIVQARICDLVPKILQSLGTRSYVSSHPGEVLESDLEVHYIMMSSCHHDIITSCDLVQAQIYEKDFHAERLDREHLASRIEQERVRYEQERHQLKEQLNRYTH